MATNETLMLCYRSACTAGAHALGYNRVTKGHYCIPCAIRINRSNPDLNLFPLLTAVDTKKLEGGAWTTGTMLVRTNQLNNQ